MQPYRRSSVKAWVRTDRDRGSLFFANTLDQPEPETGGGQAAGARVVPFAKKVKKWKWIQITVENDQVNEGFGVYGIIIRHQKLNMV